MYKINYIGIYIYIYKHICYAIIQILYNLLLHLFTMIWIYCVTNGSSKEVIVTHADSDQRFESSFWMRLSVFRQLFALSQKKKKLKKSNSALTSLGSSGAGRCRVEEVSKVFMMSYMFCWLFQIVLQLFFDFVLRIYYLQLFNDLYISQFDSRIWIVLCQIIFYLNTTSFYNFRIHFWKILVIITFFLI